MPRTDLRAIESERTWCNGPNMLAGDIYGEQETTFIANIELFSLSLIRRQTLSLPQNDFFFCWKTPCTLPELLLFFLNTWEAENPSVCALLEPISNVVPKGCLHSRGCCCFRFADSTLVFLWQITRLIAFPEFHFHSETVSVKHQHKRGL